MRRILPMFVLTFVLWHWFGDHPFASPGWRPMSIYEQAADCAAGLGIAQYTAETQYGITVERRGPGWVVGRRDTGNIKGVPVVLLWKCEAL